MSEPVQNPPAFPDVSSPPQRPESVPYYPGLEEQRRGEGGRNIAPTANQSWWEQVGLNTEGSWFGNPTYPGSVVRWATEKAVAYKAEQDGEKPVSAEEARKRWPGVIFSGEVLPSIAQYRYDTINRQKTTQEWIASGPPIGTLSGAGASITSLVNSPLDLAAGFGAGRLVGAGVKALGLAGRAGLAGVATNFGENVVGNIAYQTPNYLLKKQQGMEVNAAEELGGAFFNAGFFTFLHYTVVKPAQNFWESRFPKDGQARAVREAIARSDAGLPPEAPTSITTATARAVGQNKSGQPSAYQIDTVGHPSERAYYQTVSPDTREAIDLTGRSVGTTYSDRAEMMRNFSENPEGAPQGKLIEGQIDPSARLLNLDQPIESPEARAIIKEVEAKLGVELDLEPRATLRQILDEVPRVEQKQVAEIIQATGMDGYKETVHVSGQPHHTVVTMFDKPADSTTSSFYPRQEQALIPGGTPDIPKDSIDLSMNDPSKQVGFDSELKQKADETLKTLPKTPEAELSSIKEQELDARRRIAATEQTPLLTEAVTNIDTEFNQEKKSLDALKRLAECVASDIL